MEFEHSHGTDTPLNRATELLREMNATNKRKLPEDAPTEFVSKTIRPLVVSDGVIDKHAWECALIRKIRDEIKSGNISVKNSKRFGAFDRFFISDTKWASLREEFFAQSGLPQKGCDAATYLSERLNLAYDKFLETLPNNTYAQVDGAGWHLSVDSAEPPDPTEEAKIDQLKKWIKKHQRHIKLPQLLIEVDAEGFGTHSTAYELHFTRHFLPLTQNQTRPVDEIAAIIAAIMAHGCNVGPETMSQLTAGVTYEQIRRITEWQLIEENQRSALAEVVNAISSLETTQNWGEGKTSASDGQRFAFRRKVLQRNYSHKFSDYALEFYSFIADNYAPFYGVPIECNSRCDCAGVTRLGKADGCALHYSATPSASVMRPMFLTGCFIMRVTWNWKNITLILTAIQRVISPLSRCSEKSFARESVKFRTSAFTVLTRIGIMVP